MSLLTVEGIFLAVSRVILRTMDECKFFRCLERVILWSRWGLAKDEFRYRIHRIQIQIQDLVSSNILLMQNWAGLKLNSSIFWGEKIRVLETKVAKFTIWYSLSFIFLQFDRLLQTSLEIWLVVLFLVQPPHWLGKRCDLKQTGRIFAFTQAFCWKETLFFSLWELTKAFVM